MSKEKTGVSQKVFRGAQQWQEIMAKYEASGLSQERFCAAQGLALSTFCSWRSRLRGEAGSEKARSEKESSFIELLAPPRDRPWDMELELCAGVVLRLRRG